MQELILLQEFFFSCSGDPSVSGILPPPPEAYEGVKWALNSQKFNGYGHSSGMLMARQAVADKFSTPEAPITAKVS